MARWQLAVDVERNGKEPVFVRIARAIAADLRRGRLRPGERLPGSRALASSLGVHRNTVVAAYTELEAEGWVETRAARGTFVVEQLADLPRRRSSAPAGAAQRTHFQLGAKPEIEMRAPSSLRFDLRGYGSHQPASVSYLSSAEELRRAPRRSEVRNG